MKYEAYSDSAKTTIWDNSLVILDKVKGSISVSTKGEFASMTLYLLAETVGGASHLKQVTFEVTTFDCLKSQRLVNAKNRGFPEFAVEYNTGMHVFSGDMIKNLFTTHIESKLAKCPVDKFTIE